VDRDDAVELPQTFYGLLEAIRKRPGMYLGRKSLAMFKAWLDGYNYARCELRAIHTAEEAEFEAFDEFVCEKYDWRDTGGWAAKIAYYHRDDADALDEFFRLLDEFRAARRLR
jgi:hypothetical protein